MAIQFYKPVMVSIEEVPIPVPSIIRRLGYPPGTKKIDKGMQIILDREMQKVPDLIRAQGIYRILQIDKRTDTALNFKDTPFSIQSRQVVKMLRDADPIVLFMVTIGLKLEKKVSALFDKGDLTEGFVLDAVGSEITDAAADLIHHHVLKKLATDNGYTLTPRFSPGYGDWSLTVQKDVLQVCRGDRIGVSLNPSSLMKPRKSVSAVVGLKKKG